MHILRTLGLALAAVAALAAATPARAADRPGAFGADGFATPDGDGGRFSFAPEADAMGVPAGADLDGGRALALPSPWIAGTVSEARSDARSSDGGTVLGAARAAVLLRSLTIPGWGQATLGHTTSATIFGLTDLGIWVSFTAFRIQEQMRIETYERTARILAGINLDGRDEEFRRIIGSYLSSDQYNQLVVFRDAANLHYDDPVAYRDYIASHSLGGDDRWAWNDVDGLLRYRAERRKAHRAELRAHTALALAVINRLVSAMHAARFDPNERAEATPPKEATWGVDVTPVYGGDPAAIRLGVHRRF